MWYFGICELTGRLLVASSGHVCVLPQRGLTAKRYPQPDFCRHDALHVHRDRLYGLHVYLAGYDIMATEVPLRRLIDQLVFLVVLPKEKRSKWSAFFMPLKSTKLPDLATHYSSYLRQQ